MDSHVLIVGAGPTGLMLACELALTGVRSVVIDRLPEASREPKANGLLGQVVRVLDHRGLLARLAGSEDAPEPISAYLAPEGLILWGGVGVDSGAVAVEDADRFGAV